MKLIGEPWDLGEGGDDSQVCELACRLSGSSDLYEDNGQLQSSSINFVTAHDGFTLNDLVSYIQIPTNTLRSCLNFVFGRCF